MPQEPKKRHSKARKRTRRAAISLASISLLKCTNCEQATIPHQVCKNCGFYAGKKVTSIGQVKVTKA
ncbi:MAG: 50S ribosomal protein L32 [Candidatus Daviesbacteria bacterium]|nr:50S ribosomal protein L32 [Candidatus Daviesbacteria bacterium]